MICPNCGATNSELALSCFQCDAELKTFKPIIQGILPSVNVVTIASIWQRVFAVLVDLLLIGILGAVIGTTFERVFGVVLAKKIEPFYSMLILWLYNAALESSPTQATLGKMLLKIAVTDLKGHRISLGTASMRFFVKFITGFGIASIFRVITDEKRQAFHDVGANTIVLQKPKSSG